MGIGVELRWVSGWSLDGNRSEIHDERRAQQGRASERHMVAAWSARMDNEAVSGQTHSRLQPHGYSFVCTSKSSHSTGLRLRGVQ